jgi:hypothetical protein
MGCISCTPLHPKNDATDLTIIYSRIFITPDRENGTNFVSTRIRVTFIDFFATRPLFPISELKTLPIPHSLIHRVPTVLTIRKRTC